MGETLISVGIDLGTSTTQVIFSRLTLQNEAAPFTVPDVKITEKELLYVSDIHFTPLISDTVIDTEGIRKIVAEEYEKAAMEKSQVDTGAVIITGETARKENAREVLQALSDFAGDFVVATAGPDLESVLAGAGAGADAYSREHACTVLHFDIGGGTTNMALYKDGILLSTGCLNIGGRLIKISHGTVSYVSPVLKQLCQIQVGQEATEAALSPVAQLLSDHLCSMALGDPETIPTALRTTPLMKLCKPIDCFSFSGGVADLIYEETTQPPFLYGDLGVLLGRAIRRSGLFAKAVRPAETIRATVIGAGSHATQLSGSTVYYQNAAFPYRNLPVLALSEPRDLEGQRLFGSEPFVLHLPGIRSPAFRQVQDMANAISAVFPGDKPMLLSVEQDMAKALGQALSLLQPGRELVCLDGLKLSPGSYLDIGMPVSGGAALPVVIKTLIFEG